MRNGFGTILGEGRGGVPPQVGLDEVHLCSDHCLRSVLHEWLVLLCVPMHSCTCTGPESHCLLGQWRTLPQLYLLVPISSEQTEEAEKEDVRVQLKRHHPSSPLSGSKTSKRPKIKVSLISQGDPTGGSCTPSQGGTPEGEFPLTCFNRH